MANIDNTTLWANNPVKFDEITAGLIFGQQDEECRTPGVIYARSRNGIPHDKIEKLSAIHPDITFYAEHSFEFDMYCKVWTIEYKAGESKEIKVEPSYMFCYEPGCNPASFEESVPCYAELEAKIVAFFKRLDVQVEGQNGLKIDWCQEEVTVTVEHDGYRMQATKHEHEIDNLKLFKSHIKTVEWQEVGNSTPDDNLPF